MQDSPPYSLHNLGVGGWHGDKMSWSHPSHCQQLQSHSFDHGRKLDNTVRFTYCVVNTNNTVCNYCKHILCSMQFEDLCWMEPVAVPVSKPDSANIIKTCQLMQNRSLVHMIWCSQIHADVRQTGILINVASGSPSFKTWLSKHNKKMSDDAE